MAISRRSLGDRRELLHLRLVEPRGVVSILELDHAAGKIAQWIEHASEDEEENAEDQRIDGEPDERQRVCVMPRLGDLVAGLAGDHDGAEVPWR